MYLNAVVFKQKEKEYIKIKVPDDLKIELQNKFCDIWRAFFNDLEVTIAENQSICKL